VTEFIRYRFPSGGWSSWHLLRLTRSLLPRTLCGRQATEGFQSRNDRPEGKTCELCFRVKASQE
jgi:hypothetical protein